jgi:hypothetical protein
LRILISSAASLRIASEQYPELFVSKNGKKANTDCGEWWTEWPKKARKDKKTKKALDLREACNKIIHAKRIRRSIASRDPHGNPDNPDAWVTPHVYLYGEKGGKPWRVKLSIVDFVKRGHSICRHIMP